uniref:Uncharacterized protein n=1 Tax=viral metagenome TaxID=1070528 RepID=A0A6C0KYU5_9ZZZZ|tara:strand:- start:3469 stop:3930 length:462 start_codon:yes stop_codon:yes gene_type:complete
MVKPSYDTQNRIEKLTAFDRIRKLKILEMFQYNFIGFIIVTILAFVFDKFFFQKTFNYFIEKHKTGKEQDKSYFGFLILCTITMMETFLILIILFYMRKLLLLFPPIGTYMDKSFTGLTTVDSVVHLTLSFLFLEFVSGYKAKTELILEYEFD